MVRKFGRARRLIAGLLATVMVAALLPIAPPTVSAVGELPGVEEALFADSSVSFNEGWVELLDDIAEGIETQIELLNDVPMLEDRLQQQFQAVVDRIDAMRTNTGDALAKLLVTGPTNEAVAQLLVDLLGPGIDGKSGLGLLKDRTKPANGVGIDDVTVTRCLFSLAGDFDKEPCSADENLKYVHFEFDIGQDFPTIPIPGFGMEFSPFPAFPAFELAAEVDTVKLNLGWTLHVGIGVQSSPAPKGFYVSTGGSVPELELVAKATFNELEAFTSVGLLATTLTDGVTKDPGRYNPSNPPKATAPATDPVVTKTSLTGNVATVTTKDAHGFKAGSEVLVWLDVQGGAGGQAARSQSEG